MRGTRPALPYCEKQLFYPLKKRRRRDNGVIVCVQADAESLEQMLVRKDTARRLHQLLHRLEEPYKEVFSLWAGFSFRQISALFGKTEPWACVTYHRAKAKLREEWENEG